MTSESIGVPNKKRKTVVGAMMDKEPDESLHEIRKLLFLNAWISLLSAKENCVSPENREELDGVHKILDSLISNWTFQHDMR